MSDKILTEAYAKLSALEEGEVPLDDLHDKAIDLLDDMLYALPEEEQYGEKGDILRYAIGRLQEVGRAR